MISITTSNTRWEKWAPWIAGVFALSPLIGHWQTFQDLWWFGDDWDLLDQIAQRGLLSWTVQAFAENFVPLFKLLWGGLVFVGGGSYFPMIAALWVTHAINAGLVVRLLRRNDFGWPGIVLVVTIFGLTHHNVETLAWSVQWSAILATTFFLLAAHWHLQRRPYLQRWDWRIHLGITALIAASALSFSRGVLTGAALAFLCLLPIGEPRSHWLSRLRTAALYLAPAFGVALTIYFVAGGNHQAIGKRDEVWLNAAEFGSWYLAVSPMYRLLEFESWGPRTTLTAGTIKLLLILAGFRVANAKQRRLLALLLVLDLGNAVLLGIGRYHTTLPSANSSRYQYNALLCTLPFAAALFDCALQALKRRAWQRGLAVATVVIVGYCTSRDWHSEAEAFARHRGRNTRELLFHDPNPPEMGAIPGISFLSTNRAKELIQHYDLH